MGDAAVIHTESDAGPWDRLLIGFNYHPSRQGCQYWVDWDEEAIDADFRDMAARGFNLVRFFVFWRDFQSGPAVFDETALTRLSRFVELADNHDLFCLPSILTIWMNGQHFDLPWSTSRDLWLDPEMRRQSVAFVGHIARALSGCKNVCAYDIGDEVIHVDLAAASGLSASEVTDWYDALCDSIRKADPGAIVVQANEASSIVGTHGFRPENAGSLDAIAVHGFPVWSPFAIESIDSYKGSLFAPFLVSVARAAGKPVIADEIGCYGGSPRTAARYMEAVTHSLVANGARALCGWCWQDFGSTDKPYRLRPDERFVGFLDLEGRAKPAMKVFERLAGNAKSIFLGLSPVPSPVGILLPADDAGNASGYLAKTRESASGAFYAFLLAKRAHIPVSFTFVPSPLFSLLLCPSVVNMTLSLQSALLDYLEAGGAVYFSTADYLHGFGSEKVFGVRLEDFCLSCGETWAFSWGGVRYDVDWARVVGPNGKVPVIAAGDAEVLASYENGTPALTCRRVGRGRAFYLNAPLEAQLDVPGKLDSAPWHSFYAKLAQEAGIRADLECTVPDVEVAAMEGTNGRYIFLINHGATHHEVTIRQRSAQEDTVLERTLALGGKSAAVLTADLEPIPLMSGVEE